MSSILFLSAAAALASDEIVGASLPNMTIKPCWKQYSGYLPTGSRGTHLFYWYHEAVTNAADKPLILWLNGGPGCSSLGGMFTELGPFVVQMNGSVTLNPYSWNKGAHRDPRRQTQRHARVHRCCP